MVPALAAGIRSGRSIYRFPKPPPFPLTLSYFRFGESGIACRGLQPRKIETRRPGLPSRPGMASPRWPRRFRLPVGEKTLAADVGPLRLMCCVREASLRPDRNVLHECAPWFLAVTGSGVSNPTCRRRAGGPATGRPAGCFSLAWPRLAAAQPRPRQVPTAMRVHEVHEGTVRIPCNTPGWRIGLILDGNPTITEPHPVTREPLIRLWCGRN